MADKTLLAAYLVTGDDEHRRRHLLERMRTRFSAMGNSDFNEDVFSGPAAEAGALVSTCNTLPFASSHRLVIVKDADKLSKPCVDALVKYLASPCATTVLYLDAGKLAGNSRLRKACRGVDERCVIECVAPKGREVTARVRDFAAARGLSMTDDAARALVSLVGEQTTRLDTEVAKLAAVFEPGSVVDAADVRRLVVRVAEPKPWEFTDALAARSASRCLSLRRAMPSQSPHSLLYRCVGMLEELLVAKDMSGCTRQALATELSKPAWMVKNHMRWAAAYSARELEQALCSAASLQARMNSGGDADLLFDCWVLETCVGSHVACAGHLANG